MNILGISDVTGNHSHACIALLQDGELTFALSEERLSRVKNDNRFPTQAIQITLDYAGLALDDIDHFVCAYPPANYYGSLLKRSKWDLPRSLLGILWRRPRKLLKYLGPNIKKGLFSGSLDKIISEHCQVKEKKFITLIKKGMEKIL